MTEQTQLLNSMTDSKTDRWSVYILNSSREYKNFPYKALRTDGKVSYRVASLLTRAIKYCMKIIAAVIKLIFSIYTITYFLNSRIFINYVFDESFTFTYNFQRFITHLTNQTHPHTYIYTHTLTHTSAHTHTHTHF